MDCPFCNETDFDDIGLKTHLLSDCEKFKQTHTAPRLFNKSLQDKMEELIGDFLKANKHTYEHENKLLREFAEKVRAL